MKSKLPVAGVPAADESAPLSPPSFQELPQRIATGRVRGYLARAPLFPLILLTIVRNDTYVFDTVIEWSNLFHALIFVSELTKQK